MAAILRHFVVTVVVVVFAWTRPRAIPLVTITTRKSVHGLTLLSIGTVQFFLLIMLHNARTVQMCSITKWGTLSGFHAEKRQVIRGSYYRRERMMTSHEHQE